MTKFINLSPQLCRVTFKSWSLKKQEKFLQGLIEEFEYHRFLNSSPSNQSVSFKNFISKNKETLRANRAEGERDRLRFQMDQIRKIVNPR